MAWPVITVEYWKDFAEFIRELPPGLLWQAPYIFRGQADAEWGLLPSLLRLATEMHVGSNYMLQIEKEVSEYFRRTISLFVETNGKNRKNHPNVPWATMQQYGAPTRLLDWTKSAYVAAYFAVESFWNKDGAIWMLNTSRLQSQMKKLCLALKTLDDGLPEKFFDIKAPREIVAFEAYETNERIHAQQGIYTVSCQISADHGKVIDDAFKNIKAPENSFVFAKLIIPAKSKPLFLKRLQEMNISANSLFPGINGLARSVNEHVRIGFAQLGAGFNMVDRGIMWGRGIHIRHIEPSGHEKLDENEISKHNI
jgi:hypothetical protein